MGEPSLRFGRYRVEATLGAGAMGEVHAAIDEALGREVAIKTIRNRGGINGQLLDDRFRQEARAIAALSHPNIVALYDVGFDGDPPYLVMERVAGPSLKEQLAAGPLSPDDARALGVQLARALAAAHARGILHRDVKPANVLAAGPGIWKLADFGVAHVPDSSLTITGQFVGSPAYAAPEALALGQFSAAADIYGLGAILYEALSGTCAFDSSSITSLASLLERRPPPPLAQVAPGVPADLAAAVARAIDPEPANRPTADELAALIARGSGSSPELGPPAASGSVAMPRAVLAVSMPGTTAAAMSQWGATAPPDDARRRRLALWIGGGVIAIGVIAALILSGDRRATPGAVSGPAPGAALATSPVADDAPLTIQANPPAGLTGKSEKEWRKVVDKLREHAWGEALDKLAHFEERFGASPETAALREQIEAVRAADPEPEPGPGDDERGPPGPPGHGHGKHGD
ncbi:MAG: protein kinase [Deltaproteobacteria bacterium]|nr:protein kinase [Deltaproteobacteria bacterium]